MLTRKRHILLDRCSLAAYAARETACFGFAAFSLEAHCSTAYRLRKIGGVATVRPHCGHRPTAISDDQANNANIGPPDGSEVQVTGA